MEVAWVRSCDVTWIHMSADNTLMPTLKRVIVEVFLLSGSLPVEEIGDKMSSLNQLYSLQIYNLSKSQQWENNGERQTNAVRGAHSMYAEALCWPKVYKVGWGGGLWYCTHRLLGVVLRLNLIKQSDWSWLSKGLVLLLMFLCSCECIRFLPLLGCLAVALLVFSLGRSLLQHVAQLSISQLL